MDRAVGTFTPALLLHLPPLAALLEARVGADTTVLRAGVALVSLVARVHAGFFSGNAGFLTLTGVIFLGMRGADRKTKPHQ
jgi:hypothetical protein